GVARGYLRDAELTASKFVNGEGGLRLYRTGDLGTWTEGGILRYLERVDRQRKVRGHRVDLAYLERRIREILHARGAHVRVGSGTSGLPVSPGEDAWLVVDVDTDDPVSADEVRERLARELPDWMLPRLVVPVNGLARTDGARVDCAAFPKPWSVIKHSNEEP